MLFHKSAHKAQHAQHSKPFRTSLAVLSQMSRQSGFTHAIHMMHAVLPWPASLSHPPWPMDSEIPATAEWDIGLFTQPHAKLQKPRIAVTSHAEVEVIGSSGRNTTAPNAYRL